MDIFEEDRIRHPYFIFTSLDTIPYYQRESIEASTIGVNNTHVVSVCDFQNYIDNIRKMECTNTLGILPSGIIPYAKRFYFDNQRIRWGFKRLLYIYRVYKSKTAIFNTECLEGETILYNPTRPPRRILCLWDKPSSRSYLFRITDLLGIFRASILGDEIHKPKNPYTNIPFTYSQIRRIHMFFQNNMDRILPDDAPILTYTRWQSVELTYDHIIQRNIHITAPFPETPYIATLLWDSIMSVESLKEDKKSLAEELRREFLKQVFYEFSTSMSKVPTTKLGYYVRTSILNERTQSPGETIRNWYYSNRIRYRVRRNHRRRG
jgi:hypothetical protein